MEAKVSELTTIFVTAEFPAQLEFEARIEAAKQRISRSELVRQAVSDYLKKLKTEVKSSNERQPA